MSESGHYSIPRLYYLVTSAFIVLDYCLAWHQPPAVRRHRRHRLQRKQRNSDPPVHRRHAWPTAGPAYAYGSSMGATFMKEADVEKVTQYLEAVPRKVWYLRDVLLMMGVVLGGGLVPLDLTTYIAGLRNDIALASKLALLLVFVAWPIIVVCLIVLCVQMVSRWPRYVSSRKKLCGLRLSVITGLAAYLILPFTPLVPEGPGGYILGFRQYIRRTADIAAIQVWLSTLQPDASTGELIYIRPNNGPAVWPDTMAWPSAITGLDPLWVQLQRIDDGRLQIRLAWGTPWGEWGAEIGPQDMEIPKTQPMWRDESYHQEVWRHGEYRLPLASGAYVWNEIR